MDIFPRQSEIHVIQGTQMRPHRRDAPSDGYNGCIAAVRVGPAPQLNRAGSERSMGFGLRTVVLAWRRRVEHDRETSERRPSRAEEAGYLKRSRAAARVPVRRELTAIIGTPA